VSSPIAPRIVRPIRSRSIPIAIAIATIIVIAAEISSPCSARSSGRPLAESRCGSISRDDPRRIPDARHPDRARAPLGDPTRPGSPEVSDEAISPSGRDGVLPRTPTRGGTRLRSPSPRAARGSCRESWDRADRGRAVDGIRFDPYPTPSRRSPAPRPGTAADRGVELGRFASRS
jgi:hypothetical protein